MNDFGIQHAVAAQNDLNKSLDEWSEWRGVRAAAVLDAIDRGITVSDVARALGISVRAAKDVYERAHAHRQHDHDGKRQALAALRDIGAEFDQVSDKYHEAVSARSKAVRLAASAGTTYAELAKEMGVAAQNVGAIDRRARERNTKEIQSIA